jgi:hypothetical protein
MGTDPSAEQDASVDFLATLAPGVEDKAAIVNAVTVDSRVSGKWLLSHSSDNSKDSAVIQSANVALDSGRHVSSNIVPDTQLARESASLRGDTVYFADFSSPVGQWPQSGVVPASPMSECSSLSSLSSGSFAAQDYPTDGDRARMDPGSDAAGGQDDATSDGVCTDVKRARKLTPKKNAGDSSARRCALCRRRRRILHASDGSDLDLGSLLGPFPIPKGLSTVFAEDDGNGESFEDFVVHEQCATWSPEVFWKTDREIVNLDRAVHRGCRIKCSVCGQFGATLGCFVEACKCSYHLPCFLSMKDFSDDMVEENQYLISCPAHRPQFVKLNIGNKRRKTNKQSNTNRIVLDPFSAAAK